MIVQAFAAVETMSDRVCIASNGTVNAHISAEDLLACCDTCGLGYLFVTVIVCPYACVQCMCLSVCYAVVTCEIKLFQNYFGLH